MIRSTPPARYRAIALLGILMVSAITLGSIVARDVRRFNDDARMHYDRLSQGFELIDELQFDTQEVRRIHLYALHTSDANRQLDYADQSRAADARVQRLLADRPEIHWAAGTHAHLGNVYRAWKNYLVVRDEVIGLILEGSLPEGVALDEQQGTARFNEVRQAIASLKDNFESDAALEVQEAEERAGRAMLRLGLMGTSAVLAAAFGIFFVRRHAALEALLRSEAHKGSILQAVPNAIISTDAEGRIIELNDAAERTFGVSRAAALGARLDEIVLPPDSRDIFSTLLAQSTNSPQWAAPRIETLGARRDGTTFPMELAAVSHTAGRDRIWTVHLSDLTERHRTEDLLRQAKTAELATQAKADFLATVSHELRTPLTGVIGIVELLRSDELPPRHRDLVRMLRSASSALFGLVSNILDYSRMEAGLSDLIPVAFSVERCIEDALDPIAELATRKGLEIGCLIEPDVPTFVVADQDRVRQILLNLLSNAVKFTDEGEVAVHVSAKAGPDDCVTISIAVRDTGCGIPANVHDQLFRRFNRIDPTLTRRHGGVGLGLPISHSLSQLLGGSLTVESAVGRGSTFTLTFNARLAPGQAATDPLDTPLSGVRVLAFLGPGIVGRQVRSLLNRWGVDAATFEHYDSSPPPDTSFDAIVVDAETRGGRLQALALKRREQWHLQKIPVIAFARASVAGAPAVEHFDHTLGIPVRAQALYETLSTVAGVVEPKVLWPKPELPPRVGAAGCLKILLVDDDGPNRRVIRMMLEELGLEVDEVASGVEAIARARSHAYDVIFMDVRMPDVDGLEATRRIKTEASSSHPVVIALTANVMRGEEARCREAGMDGYLPKPLRLNTLAAVLAPYLPEKL